jgi:integrase
MPSRVTERNGRYTSRFSLGGKMIHVGTFDTREAAREASMAASAAHPRPERKPKPKPDPSPTVTQWSERWQKLYPGRRNPQTAEHNRQMTGPFVKRYGSRKLESITALEAQEWAIRYPGSVRYLRLMFAKAERAELVSRNVWERVEVPSRRRRNAVPSVEMIDRMAQVARARGNDHLADLILFAAYSGLRLSEVAGVQASDVLGERVAVRSAKRHGGEEVRSRVAAVMGPGRAALARQVPEIGVVWHTPTGRPLTRESMGRLFKPVAEEAGHAGTFHSLRAFHASWLADLGADRRDIAIQLGHVDEAGRPYPDMADRHYSKPTPEIAFKRLEGLTG